MSTPTISDQSKRGRSTTPEGQVVSASDNRQSTDVVVRVHHRPGKKRQFTRYKKVAIHLLASIKRTQSAEGVVTVRPFTGDAWDLIRARLRQADELPERSE